MDYTNIINKEIKILRKAVDYNEKMVKSKKMNNPEISKIINIVEEFIISKKLICYGGTAINNILPDNLKFYNKDLELPDYDFFSPRAMEHAIQLANKYYKEGYTEVLASAGVHYGTYKVFVNFIPVADITLLPRDLFNSLLKSSLQFSNIHYAPPNFLRMSMYLELSRPEGDISRWEKVLKRLVLLNQSYPLKVKNCNKISFQQKFYKESGDPIIIFNLIKDFFIKQNVVFFGGYAVSLYGKYMPSSFQKKIEKEPDFDVISMDGEKLSILLKEYLITNNIENIKIKKHLAIADIIPDHYEIMIHKDIVAFIYTSSACHNYNIIKYKSQSIKIATIDTMLSFYLAFIYANKPYYNIERILCMANYLFIVQQKNRLNQKGLLKRFVSTCYGNQPTKETIREIKQNIYRELKAKKKNSKTSKTYKKWFLKYDPSVHKNKTKKNIEKTKQNTKKRKLKKNTSS